MVPELSKRHKGVVSLLGLARCDQEVLDLAGDDFCSIAVGFFVPILFFLRLYVCFGRIGG